MRTAFISFSSPSFSNRRLLFQSTCRCLPHSHHYSSSLKTSSFINSFQNTTNKISNLLPYQHQHQNQHRHSSSSSSSRLNMTVTKQDRQTSESTDKLPHGYDYDLFVIGAGSGGVRASRIASNHGAKVIVAENGPLGGTCVNVGCVPKKLFVYGSHYGHDFSDSFMYGWDLNGTKPPTVNWGRLIKNKNTEIERLNGIYNKILDRAGVDLVKGTAKFIDDHTVEVDGKTFTSNRILIATGGKPFVPDNVEGHEHIITSNEAFYLKDLPKDVVIVGGGYIAVEFACILKGYGANVTLVYRGDLFLRGFDKDVRTHLAEQMTLNGINLKFGSKIQSISKDDHTGILNVKLDNSDDIIQSNICMYATGRIPNIDGLGIENSGVKLGPNNKIIVDEWSKTNVDHIYAIGDVTDKVQLTPVAIAEGHALADTLFGNNKRNTNYEYIPTAVFSTPSIGTCGLTEEQARTQYNNEIDIYKTSFKPMKHTLTKREGEKVLMKLIVHRPTDLVVGCHILDYAAGDMIQLVGVAMKAGATKKHFDSTMPVHPVSAEELVTLRTKEPDA